MATKLTKVDPLTLSRHLDLQEGDECFYWGEFQVGGGFGAGPTNQLINNIKIEPSLRGSGRYYYKERDIERAGRALAGPIRASAGPFTVVPVPPSKTPGDPDYDDRMIRIARIMVHGTNSEVRELIRQTCNYEASHTAGSGNRITVERLLEIYEIDDPGKQPNNTVIVLDDMLTKGSHFRAMKTKILEHFPGRRVVGLFVARAVE